MANFSFKTFSQLLQDMIDTMTANAPTVTNFGNGSVVRVLFEAICGRLDYFTTQLRLILLLCRLATSTSSDIDSFIADFGMDPRLPAVASSGHVTCTRFTIALSTVFIAVGATITTSDNTLTFTIIADPSNTNFNAGANGYFIPSNQASVDVTAQCNTPGIIGNVGIGAISVIGATLPGVDQVANAAPFENGNDAESDASVRARFVLFIQTRARATLAALQYAVSIVQSGLITEFKENVDIDLNPRPGTVLVVVDDGSGFPSDALLTAVRASLDLYRGFTITIQVYAPVVDSIDLSCLIVVDPAYSASAVTTAVQNALIAYLDTQSIGAFLSNEKTAAIAFSVPGVIDCDNMELNGFALDIQPLWNHVVKAGTVTVTHS